MPIETAQIVKLDSGRSSKSLKNCFFQLRETNRTCAIGKGGEINFVLEI